MCSQAHCCVSYSHLWKENFVSHMDLGKVSSPLLPLQTKLTHPTMRINTHTHTNKNKKITKLNHENEHTHTQKDTKRSPTNLNQEIITQNNQYNQF